MPTVLTTLFAAPFRIFFLSLALWAVVIVPLWLVLLLTPLQLPLLLPAPIWHQHEMLFGFLNAAVAGFLLTAVGTWTGTRPLHGGPLLALWLVWVAGRVLLLGAGGSPVEGLAHALELIFLPLVILDAGRRVARTRQWRQLIVLQVLTLLWLMQLGFHLQPSPRFAGGAMLLAMALMLVIGGRITPAFTANWLRAQGREGEAAAAQAPAWIDATAIGLTLLLLPVYLLQPFGPALIPAITLLTVTAALAVALRLGYWRGWRVYTEPLLWVLHLSLAWIPVALLLMAGSNLGWWPATVWQHAAGMGAMGGLILGVISRVALGHTGRPLQLPGGMIIAFAAIHAGALVRVLTALSLLPWQRGLEIAVLCWILAFGLFLIRYAGVLSSPRPDGKAG